MSGSNVASQEDSSVCLYNHPENADDSDDGNYWPTSVFDGRFGRCKIEGLADSGPAETSIAEVLAMLVYIVGPLHVRGSLFY